MRVARSRAMPIAWLFVLSCGVCMCAHVAEKGVATINTGGHWGGKGWIGREKKKHGKGRNAKELSALVMAEDHEAEVLEQAVKQSLAQKAEANAVRHDFGKKNYQGTSVPAYQSMGSRDEPYVSKEEGWASWAWRKASESAIGDYVSKAWSGGGRPPNTILMSASPATVSNVERREWERGNEIHGSDSMQHQLPHVSLGKTSKIRDRWQMMTSDSPASRRLKEPLRKVSMDSSAVDGRQGGLRGAIISMLQERVKVSSSSPPVSAKKKKVGRYSRSVGTKDLNNYPADAATATASAGSFRDMDESLTTSSIVVDGARSEAAGSPAGAATITGIDNSEAGSIYRKFNDDVAKDDFVLEEMPSNDDALRRGAGVNATNIRGRGASAGTKAHASTQMLDDYVKEHFQTYDCGDASKGTECSDGCYHKILRNIAAAPAAGDTETSNWVVCNFVRAGAASREKCGSGEVTDSRREGTGSQLDNLGWETGRIAQRTSDGPEILSGMEEWLTTIRNYCYHTPVISHIKIEIASSTFELVLEHRRDCMTRIYQASPSNVWGLATWLRNANEPLTPLEVYPWSVRIPQLVARGGSRDAVRLANAQGVEAIKELDQRFVGNVTKARRMYGEGRPLDEKEFSSYVLRLKDAYTTYCDALHNPHRNAWMQLQYYLSCGVGRERQKPKAQYLFLDNFGENLDRCSPNQCTFDFDVFAYDERACDVDAAREAERTATVKTPGLSNMPYVAGSAVQDDAIHLPIDWDALEQSPAAEDEDFDVQHSHTGAQTLNLVNVITDFLTTMAHKVTVESHNLKRKLIGERPREMRPVVVVSSSGSSTGVIEPEPGAPVQDSQAMLDGLSDSPHVATGTLNDDAEGGEGSYGDPSQSADGEQNLSKYDKLRRGIRRLMRNRKNKKASAGGSLDAVVDDFEEDASLTSGVDDESNEIDLAKGQSDAAQPLAMPE